MSDTSIASKVSMTLSQILSKVGQQEKQIMLQAMADEMTNHVRLRGTFRNPDGRLNSKDMELFLKRIDLIEETIALSMAGPETFRPRPNGGQLRETVNLQELETNLREVRQGG